MGRAAPSTRHLYSPKHRICCFLWIPKEHLQAAGAGTRAIGHPSRKLLCGAMQTLCLLSVSQLQNGWQVMTPSIREERGYPPGPWAVGYTDADQMCLSCPQAAWPGKPQLRKVTQALAQEDSRSMGSPASSNKFLFGACLDLLTCLEFETRQNTGARSAVSHLLAAMLLHLKQVSVSKTAPGKLPSCLQTLEPQLWDVYHLCSTASLDNHCLDPFHSSREMGSGGDKRRFPMVKAAHAMLVTEKRQGVTMARQG